jgi:hypothetical protein
MNIEEVAAKKLKILGFSRICKFVIISINLPNRIRHFFLLLLDILGRPLGILEFLLFNFLLDIFHSKSKHKQTGGCKGMETYWKVTRTDLFKGKRID